MLPITVCIPLVEYGIKPKPQFRAIPAWTRTHTMARAQTQNWYQMHGGKKKGEEPKLLSKVSVAYSSKARMKQMVCNHARHCATSLTAT